MTSSTNERQIKRRAEQAARDRVTDEFITKDLMASYEGRRWVWMRLGEAQMFHEDTDLDPQRMAYMKGKRSAGHRLLSDVQKFCPTQYVLMVNEAQTIQATIMKKEPNYVGSPNDDDGSAGDSGPGDGSGD